MGRCGLSPPSIATISTRRRVSGRPTLGFDVEGVIEGRYIALSGPGISLTLQRVPEAKTVKNRMHIDLLVDDVPAEVGRLESLGATRMTPAPPRSLAEHFAIWQPNVGLTGVAVPWTYARAESVSGRCEDAGCFPAG